MATTLNMTLLLRRAAFADSCVLQAGEPGYHITTKEFTPSPYILPSPSATA